MTFATLNIIHGLLQKAKEEKYAEYRGFLAECERFAEQNGLYRIPKDLQFKVDRLYAEYLPYSQAMADFNTQDFR